MKTGSRMSIRLQVSSLDGLEFCFHMTPEDQSQFEGRGSVFLTPERQAKLEAGDEEEAEHLREEVWSMFKQMAVCADPPWPGWAFTPEMEKRRAEARMYMGPSEQEGNPQCEPLSK